MNFDLMSLECFLAVAKTKSFSKAAAQIGRTQSAISQQILKLEKQLRKTLIIRGKSCAITFDGEVLLGYAQQISTLCLEVFDRFQEPELEGKVRFGLPEDFASLFLTEVLIKFTNIHPNILLDIECDLTLNLLQRFKNKELDLVLVKMNSPKEFSNGVEMWSEPLEWVGGDKNLLLCSDKPIPLVLSPQPCVYRKRAISSLKNFGESWRIVFSSHSFAGRIAAVKAGIGITVLPRNMIPHELSIIRSSKILPILDNAPISLIKHQCENAAINSFEKFILQKLKP